MKDFKYIFNSKVSFGKVILSLGILLIVIVSFMTFLFCKVVNNNQCLRNSEIDNNETELPENSKSEKSSLDCTTYIEDAVEEIIDLFENYETPLVTADLPKGWEIVNKVNGDGASSFTSEYSSLIGLTGLEILNTKGEIVFQLKASYYPSGAEHCGGLYVFEDSPIYEESELFEGVGGDKIPITNVSEGDYVEINFLGLRRRRVGKDLVADIDTDNNTFESNCFSFMDKISPDGLSYFVISEVFDANIYDYNISEGVSDTDLLLLDRVLESMKVSEQK